MSPDRGDRRLQLVRHVGHEIAAALLQVLQLAAHAIEGRGELADLVPTPCVHAHGIVARLHPPGGGSHVPQRLCHASRHQSRDDEGHARRDDAHEEELPPDALQEAGRRGEAAEEASRGGPRERGHRPTVGGGHGREDVRPEHPPARSLHAQARQLTEIRTAGLGRSVRVEDHHHRARRHGAQPARRGPPRETQSVDRLGVARGVAQRERDQEVTDQQRQADGDHDRRSELRSDRREPVQRARGHRHSLNAYPTPWTVRMKRGSLPSSPILRRRRATCESTTRPPAWSR